MAVTNVPVRSPQECGKLLSLGVIVGGGLAGLLGGILMAIAATIYAGVNGSGAWMPMQMVAATFYGPMAFVAGGDVIAIGWITHLATASAYGMFFAALTARTRSLVVSFVLGILYGIVLWAFMTYVILQVFDRTMAARVPMMNLWWFFLHWIYGGLLGLFTPPLRATLGCGFLHRYHSA